MSYCIEKKETVDESLPRIVAEQVDKAIIYIDKCSTADDTHKAIHEVRKRCKKIRGLLRLIRPALPNYSEENAYFRNLARSLASERDARSRQETWGKLSEGLGTQLDPDVRKRIDTALTSYVKQKASQNDLSERLKQARQQLVAGKVRSQNWNDISPKEMMNGLKKTYTRGRKALENAQADSSFCLERLHELRKRTKYHHYHIKLLRRLWNKPLGGHSDGVKQVSDRLGDHRDLGLLIRLLDQNALSLSDKDSRVLRSIAERHFKESESRILAESSKVYPESPKSMTKRMATYWDLGRKTFSDSKVKDDKRKVS